MSLPGGAPDDPFEAQVLRIRAGAVLGRSHGLAKVFDFLVEHSRAGESLREIDVATEVFGRSAAADLSGDASVRVYVHRLRRKLDEFYAGAGADEAERLTVPRGEYRLVVEPHVAAAPQPAKPRFKPWMAAVVAILALNLAGWAALVLTRPPADGFETARRSVMWRGVTGVERPVILVLGDYYIFGDAEDGREIRRLVRAFDINSRADLDEYLMANPHLMDRYVDMDLHYVPVGGALALRNVLPLLRGAVRDGSRIQTVTASELTPEMLKANDIVYVGYLSGLGLLSDPVFRGSRLGVGESFDEIIDRQSGRHFFSEAGGARPQTSHRDYSYLASFTGPSGNRIVVVAGTRDIGVMQAAEAATSPASLKALGQRLGEAGSLEALYEVEGIGRMNLNGRPVFGAPRGVAAR